MVTKNWVWVDRDGMYYAVMGDGTKCCFGSAENAKDACRSGKGVWHQFGEIFAMRPLSFAEYAKIGGDLDG